MYNIIKQGGAGVYTIHMAVLVDNLADGGEYGHLLIRGNQENSFITPRSNGNYYYKLTSTVKMVENEWYFFTGSFIVTNSDISATSGLFNLCFDFITPTANQNIYIDNVKIIQSAAHTEPLTVLPTEATLFIGDRLVLDINRYNNLTFTSSDPNVARVYSNGIVHALSSGRTTITVNYNNTETAECVIDVKSIEDGVYYVKNIGVPGYMQLKDNVTDNIIINSYNNADNQKWRIEYTGSGYYKIISAESYLAITVISLTQNNKYLAQKTYENLDTQQWKIVQFTKGSYKIIPKSDENTSFCLTANAYINHEDLIKSVDLCNYNSVNTDTAHWILDPVKKNAIVIIPGITGSNLQTKDGIDVWPVPIMAQFLTLYENGESKNDIIPVNGNNGGAVNIYKTLYDNLYNEFHDHFDIIFFDYDFRLSNDDAAKRLEKEIMYYDKVVLVAHSMGGLVASNYLANKQQNRDKSLALISLGTPYVGSATCIDAMETGNLLSLPLGDTEMPVFKQVVKKISKNSYAAYQLLPTNQYYNYTYYYPLKFNGEPFNEAYPLLKNMEWEKKQMVR